MSDSESESDDTVQLVCEECERTGDVGRKVLNLETHWVAFEETENGLVLQWQQWDGHWFCHTCLADHAAGDDAEQYYPESVSSTEGK